MSKKLIINKLNEIAITKKVLGYGSLSTVYYGVHKKSNKKLAIKVIDLDKIETCNLINIKRELKNHKELKHKNILKLYNNFIIKNKLYIIFEYAENGNLYNYLKKNNLNNMEISKIIYELCDALEYIHKKNIIHRDIKPENILLFKNNKIKLADFGWSSIFSNENRRFTICGTKEYMSPEILEQKEQNEKIDIWSIGILIYELFHKKSPFNNLNKLQILKKIKLSNYTFSWNICKEAIDLIKKILVYNKNDRLNIKQIKLHNFFNLNYNNTDNLKNKVKDIPKIIKKKLYPKLNSLNIKQAKILPEKKLDSDIKSKSKYYFITKEQPKILDFKFIKPKKKKSNSIFINNIKNLSYLKTTFDFDNNVYRNSNSNKNSINSQNKIFDSKSTIINSYKNLFQSINIYSNSSKKI